MEKEIKLILQSALALLVAFALLKWLRGKRNKDYHRNDPTQVIQKSSVWFDSLAGASRAEAYSQQPEAALFIR